MVDSVCGGQCVWWTVLGWLWPLKKRDCCVALRHVHSSGTVCSIKSTTLYIIITMCYPATLQIRRQGKADQDETGAQRAQRGLPREQI